MPTGRAGWKVEAGVSAGAREVARDPQGGAIGRGTMELGLLAAGVNDDSTTHYDFMLHRAVAVIYKENSSSGGSSDCETHSIRANSIV